MPHEVSYTMVLMHQFLNMLFFDEVDTDKLIIKFVLIRPLVCNLVFVLGRNIKNDTCITNKTSMLENCNINVLFKDRFLLADNNNL